MMIIIFNVPVSSIIHCNLLSNTTTTTIDKIPVCTLWYYVRLRWGYYWNSSNLFLMQCLG